MRLRTAMLLALTAACAPAAVVPPAAPAPEPAVPSANPLLDRCPDASDGPSLVAMAIESAHRSLATDPTAKLPPACVLVTFARTPGAVPDSLIEHALTVATALERRGTDQRDLLIGEIALLARVNRFAELSRAYDRLVVIDTLPPYDVVRVAAAAARMRGDSVALRAVIARAAARIDAPQTMRNENNVLRQVAPLLAAITTARGLIRQNPRYVEGYPSIVANFGTLGQADSVIAYVRRGLAQGATRASLTPSIESLVNTTLRHASIYAATFEWDAAIARATRVDSALSTPATKYLLASLRVQFAGPSIASAEGLVNGALWWPPGRNAGSVPESRAEGCARLSVIGVSLGSAEAAMSQGGDAYPSGAAELRGALSVARSQLARLSAVCGG